jgi:uncharacterized protein (TIGR02145 family)
MIRLFNDLNQKMKTTKHTFKKSATLATIFLFFFTFQTKAQDLSGTYSIHRATDGVMNKNIGTVELSRYSLTVNRSGSLYSLVNGKYSRTLSAIQAQIDYAKRTNAVVVPERFPAHCTCSNNILISPDDTTSIQSSTENECGGEHGYYFRLAKKKELNENVYEYKECINGYCTTTLIKINGNEIEAPLADGTFESDHSILDYTPLNDGWKSWIEYANIDNASYPYLIRRHETETKAVLNSEGKRVHGRDCDVFEMVVKIGSPPYELGWILSENAIKSTEFIKLNMVWTDNLKVSKFNNGEMIPQAKTVAEWQAACKAKKPVWCYYKFNPANDAKFGKIYNYYAVIDSRGLAPKGFHIAKESDFDLFRSVMETYDNNGVKEYIFTDEFKEQLGGYFNGQIFDLAEGDMLAGKWWTSTKRVVNSSVFNSSTGTYYTNKEILVYEFDQSQSVIALDTEDGLRTTTVKYQEFKKNWRISESKYSPQAEGYSVRCVKD